MTILEAMGDAVLFRPWFRPWRSWAAWRAFLGALFALPLEGADLETFQRCTGREAAPTAPAREAWVIAGRRAGKSRIAALIATYLAAFRDYSAQLAPGEMGVVLLLAADTRQARVILRYIRAFFERVPMLAALVTSQTSETITLTTGVSIEVRASSFRTTRGFTVVAAVCDELAFWYDEDSANPDREILAALRPAMATILDPLLLVVSSPYARRGELWAAYRRLWGQAVSGMLCWKASTRTVNPLVDAATIARAFEEDPAAASAEYGAEFRTDVEGFLTREAVEAAVVPGRRELGAAEGRRYVGFVDPSGGSGDAMTLAIAHSEADRVVIDVLEERRPPFAPEAVTADYASRLRSYGVGVVTGDAYSGEWVRSAFMKHGVAYRLASLPKSGLYREALPLFNQGKVELLDSPRLVAQLVGLERRVARGGRESIDHAPGGHDDLANAVAGVVHELAGRRAGRVQVPAEAADLPERWACASAGMRRGDL